MDFSLTPDQVEFRDATRKLCAGRFPIAELRARDRLDPAMWDELRGFGVFDALDVADAALVFEELGRALIPGPLVWSHLAGSIEMAGGVVGGVVRTPGPAVIQHLEDLDHLVVLDDDGVWSVDPHTLVSTAARPLDPLTSVGIADALPQGDRIGDAATATAWRRRGTVLVAAQLAGLAGALTDLTVAYVSERQQFGQVIGSFQAVKHQVADMLVRSEVARTQAYAAATLIDEGSPSAARAVSSAKSVAGRAAIANGKASIQAQGGMGYTWEVDSHLYLKRAWVLDSLFGTSDDHADAVADLLTPE